MSQGLPAVKPRQVLRVLERAGFEVHHVTGSHLRVTIAWHNKDLKAGTLRSIIKQAGLTTEEFVDLL